MNLVESLKSGNLLLADGATGTLLQSMGLPVGAAPERWTLEKPECIRNLARRYAEAGSDLVYTNTFGANRIRAERFGLGDKLVELNRSAVQLAREGVAAAKSVALVVASIGPTGEMLEPYGELPANTAREAFVEQARALSEAGVDAIVCESFTDLNEARLCLEATRSVSKVPVIVSLSFEQSGRTMMGVTPEDAVAYLRKEGAEVVGANCSVGPEAIERVISAMNVACPGVHLIAKPNAGMPQVIDGQAVYSTSPGTMAAFAARMKLLGVAIVGGCCGTTPAHVSAMRQALSKKTK